MEMNNKKRKKYPVYVSVLLCLFFLIALWARNWQRPASYKTCSGIVWTTQYNITYESDRMFDDSIQNIFTAVDNSLSMFNKSSLITRINNNEDVRADSMLEYLYSASVKVHNDTDGAFDPTVSPLMKAWGFVKKTGTLPDDSVIDSIREFVGIAKTELVDGYLKKQDCRTSFDFSAIAKGYACDEIGRMFMRNGIDNYLVEVGGEISLNGVNQSGKEWHISVDSPIESADSVVHESVMIVKMGAGGIATSGNYRNYKDVDGKKVVHTMNPKTGRPEISNLLSATIIAKNCMYADAYATACMVLGKERSQSILGVSRDLGVFLVYVADDGSLATWCNDAFKAKCLDADAKN